MLAAAGWIVVVVLAALLAPVLPIPGPLDPDFSHLAEGPTTAHLLGTDALGRDELSRLVHGTRSTLAVSLSATVLGLAVGCAMGVVAGALRGPVDGVLSAVTDVMLAFPALVLALTLVTFLGPSAKLVAFVIAIVATPSFARVARAATIGTMQRDFVFAARALGVSPFTVLRREVLPQVLPSVCAYALVILAIVVVGLAELSFLGVGVPPPQPTWGGMISEARGSLAEQPSLVLIPAATLMLTVLALNIAGDRLATRLDPRSRAGF